MREDTKESIAKLVIILFIVSFIPTVIYTMWVLVEKPEKIIEARCTDLCNTSRVLSCVGKVEHDKFFIVICADKELGTKTIVVGN